MAMPVVGAGGHWRPLPGRSAPLAGAEVLPGRSAPLDGAAPLPGGHWRPLPGRSAPLDGAAPLPGGHWRPLPGRCAPLGGGGSRVSALAAGAAPVRTVGQRLAGAFGSALMPPKAAWAPPFSDACHWPAGLAGAADWPPRAGGGQGPLPPPSP